MFSTFADGCVKCVDTLIACIKSAVTGQAGQPSVEFATVKKAMCPNLA